MSFDYEQSIWGRGVATLNHADPTAFRLEQSLQALAGLPADAKALEVGCGAGQFIRAIKQIHSSWECVGTDISVKALDIAKEIGGDISFVEQSPEQLPFADNTYSAVLVYDVLEHASNPEALLKEINRVLKPNGILYCFVPCEGDRLSVWRYLRLFAQWHDMTEKHAGHINHWSRDTWWRTILSAGYTVQSVRYSEHVFGQLAGVIAFWLMDRAARKGVQTNNEEYFSKDNRFSAVRKFLNSLIYWESELLKRIPSPNVHFVCKK